jgi:hypothetical protein
VKLYVRVTPVLGISGGLETGSLVVVSRSANGSLWVVAVVLLCRLFVEVSLGDTSEDGWEGNIHRAPWIAIRHWLKGKRELNSFALIRKDTGDGV